MLNRLAQFDSLWAMVEQLLGWLPCVQLQLVCTDTRLSEYSREVLWNQLAIMGLRLPRAVRLPASTLIQLVYLSAVRPVLQMDDPRLRGSHWDGHTDRAERRVVVRHLPQNPRRDWITLNSQAVRLEQLHRRFRSWDWQNVMTILRAYASNCRRHSEVTRLTQVEDGRVRRFRVTVVTLYCTLFRFEVMLRNTTAIEGLSFLQTSSDSS